MAGIRIPYLPAPCEFDYRPVIIIVEKDAGTNQTDAVCHYNNIITLNYRYYCYYYCYRVDVIRYCGGQVSYSAVGQPRFSHTPVIRFSRVSCAHVLYTVPIVVRLLLLLLLLSSSSPFGAGTVYSTHSEEIAFLRRKSFRPPRVAAAAPTDSCWYTVIACTRFVAILFNVYSK